MATDGPTPAPCDPDIFKNGVSVFMTNSIPSNAMEGWVRQVAALSEQSVDWHFAGGRAVVMTTGSVARVKAAIVELLPEHDRLFKVAADKLNCGDFSPPRYFFDEEK